MSPEREKPQKIFRLKAIKPAIIFWLFTVAVIFFAPTGAYAGAKISSETILRFYERQEDGGGEVSLMPLYEYLALELWRDREEGLSFHSQLWGRADLGEKSGEDSSDGELLYGYLQYITPGFDVRVGRQSIYEGVANEPLDGGSINIDLGNIATLSLYGGLSVSMAEEDGRSGDIIYGGRLSQNLPGVYSVGLSYKNLSNDSDVIQELAGIDIALMPLPATSLMGRSTLNTDSTAWAEHSYEALISIGDFTFRPHYWSFDYDEIFGAGDKTPGPFQFLADGDEQVTVIGGAIDFHLTEETVMVELKGDSYSYEERDENATYTGVALELRTAEITGAGAEIGRMDGETSDNSYTLTRGYAQWRKGDYLLSGDIIYASYDEPVLGEDDSLFLSLGGGMSFMDGSLTMKLSGDYTSGPYFDEDLRAMVTCDYRFMK